jgi:iron complex outermembrane receptor protein
MFMGARKAWLWSTSLIALSLPFSSIGPAGAQTVLREIEVIASSPLSQSSDRDKVPANTHILTPADFDSAKSSSLAEAMQRRIPGLLITDVTGNPYQPDIQYRGFVASPVVGTAQGLAVYQNGVRINETFGDTVNWDFIPENAIDRMNIVPNNPVFGLNALGGAVVVTMKDGFTYQGAEAEIRGGSFGRQAMSAQVGGQRGNVAGYVAADAIKDRGWRDRSDSRLRRLYGDIGVRGEKTEFHLNFTTASNFFGATGPTPVQMLQQNWHSVYTTPQTTKNELIFLNANGKYAVTDTLTLQGNVYYRGFRQKHVDGNTSEAEICEAPFDTLLCLGGDDTLLTSTGGNTVEASILNGNVPGTIDRTATRANTFGGSLQAISAARLFEHDNQFVAGVALDRGRVNFKADSELGTIGPDLFITGTGVVVQQPAGDIAPVSLDTTSTYTGFYATNTFDVTSALSVTAGGRFNIAQIKLEDQLGTALNGSHLFTRFNPVIGATYKLTPGITAYLGYSEANRAPTPAELGCSDPARPCLLDNFLVADPPLQQVVSHTYEAGLRGKFDAGPLHGQMVWNLGLFHTRNSNDIINIASEIAGRGYFQNAGGTRRRGFEAAVTFQSAAWQVYANYTYLEATFQSTLTLQSPDNPMASPDGTITVAPGNVMPSMPRHRFKTGAEYSFDEKWKLGADLLATSGQYLRGDESNLNEMLPGYWMVNLHSSYKVTPNIEVFGLVQNLFNKHYYTFGTFFERDAIPFLNVTDPRMMTPGAPLAAYVGLRAKL